MCCACVCRLLCCSLLLWISVFLLLAILYEGSQPPEPEISDLVRELVDQYTLDGPLPSLKDDECLAVADDFDHSVPLNLAFVWWWRYSLCLLNKAGQRPRPDPSDIPEAPLPAAVTQGLAQPRAPFVV